MEDTKAETTTDELEVVQVFRIDSGRRIDLQCVIVVRGVFEKTVEWIEHLVRKQEKELSEPTTIIIGDQPGCS
jgi:hypothetical protein